MKLRMPTPKKVAKSPLNELVRFFSNLKFRINIQMSHPPPKVDRLFNKFEAPEAVILGCNINSVFRFDKEKDTLVELTAAEMDTIILRTPEIKFVCTWGIQYGINPNFFGKEFPAPSAEGFTLRQVLDVFCKWEAECRAAPFGVWFGGIDAHLVAFEGFTLDEDERLEACWGA